MEIFLSEEPRENIFSASNEWGDRNTLSVPLTLITDEWEVIDAKLQGFVGSSDLLSQGRITEHKEDDGVYEIYVPLSGSFEVTTDGNKAILKGDAPNLKEFGESATISIDEDMNTVLFRTILSDGKEVEIAGFIISPGVMHSAEIISEPGRVSRYVSIKLKKK
jgi:hypothetical protein